MQNEQRLSLSALSAQLLLKENALCVVVEGETEQDLLRRHFGDNDDSLDIYWIGDLDVPLKGDVGNKERVVFTLSESEVKEFADSAIVGLIDRDFDFYLGAVIIVKGIYYTEFACFTSQVLRKDVLIAVFASAFAKDLSSAFLEEVDCFASMIWPLKAWVKRERSNKGIPKLEGRMRSLSEGGFDWKGYLAACQSSLGRTCSLSFLQRAGRRLRLRGEMRVATHFHTVVEYVWRLARKEGLIDNSVKLEELYRHLRVQLIKEIGECGSVKLIAQKLGERREES